MSKKTPRLRAVDNLASHIPRLSNGSLVLLAFLLAISTGMSYFAYSVDTHEQGTLGGVLISVLWIVGPQLALAAVIRDWLVAIIVVPAVGALALFLCSGLWRKE